MFPEYMPWSVSRIINRDIPPLPIGGHAPGDALLRLWDGLTDGGADRTKPRPDGRVLLVDVGVDAVHVYPPAMLTNSPRFRLFSVYQPGRENATAALHSRRDYAPLQ